MPSNRPGRPGRRSTRTKETDEEQHGWQKENIAAKKLQEAEQEKRPILRKGVQGYTDGHPLLIFQERRGKKKIFVLAPGEREPLLLDREAFTVSKHQLSREDLADSFPPKKK